MANHLEDAMNSNNGSGWKHKLEKWIVSFHTESRADQDNGNNGTGQTDSNGKSENLDLKEKIPEWWW